MGQKRPAILAEVCLIKVEMRDYLRFKVDIQRFQLGKGVFRATMWSSGMHEVILEAFGTRKI